MQIRKGQPCYWFGCDAVYGGVEADWVLFTLKSHKGETGAVLCPKHAAQLRRQVDWDMNWDRRHYEENETP